MEKNNFLELHKKLNGKIEIKSKTDLKNKKQLSELYTPGAAEPAKKISENKKYAYDYTIKKNTIAIISDGSAVLGLGNIGPEASLPILEGKSLIFKEFANINAYPICINTQNSEEIIKTIKNISSGFGAIILEDISAPRCFYIENELKKELNIPVMHDDQHGTAIVILASLINSLKITGKKFSDIKITISGAGAAGIATTKLLTCSEFEKEFGKIKDIIVLDSKGIITKNRDNLNEYKKEIAELTNKNNISGNLEKAIENADVFIGLSVGGNLTQQMIKKMNLKPIIFALSNPEPSIMPDKAKEAGAKIIATGRSDFNNQINNALIFPGLIKGVLESEVKQITEKIKIVSAKALANTISEKELNSEKIIPDIFDKKVVENISNAIKELE